MCLGRKKEGTNVVKCWQLKNLDKREKEFFVIFLQFFFKYEIFLNKLFYFILFFLFQGHTAAYGGSQARGRIRATAAGLHHSHSNARSKPCQHSHVHKWNKIGVHLFCDLHHSSRQQWILNLLSEARDRIHNLMVSSQIHFRCITTGTLIFKKILRET